jgi:serine/threonine-protein kinase RsbW
VLVAQSQRPVTVEIPASSAYLVLARVATSSVCARLDYPVDRLEDVALAVSEAAALLLQDARPGARLRITLTPRTSAAGAGLDIAVSARTRSGRPPRPTSLTWTILGSLVERLSAELGADDEVTLRLQSRPVPAVPA